jgi:hypothetical protein
MSPACRSLDAPDILSSFPPTQLPRGSCTVWGPIEDACESGAALRCAAGMLGFALRLILWTDWRKMPRRGVRKCQQAQ